MFELTCPHCECKIPVTPAKAGGEIACIECQKPVTVPKLGELKSLPRIEDAAEPSLAAPRGLSGGRSMAFAAMGAVALLCLMGAAFCGVNWATIDVPATTESHLQSLQDTYAQVSASRLIREYEDITKFGVSVPQPYAYRTIELSKQAWANKAIAFGGLGLLAAVVSVFIGRRSSPKPQT